MTEPIPPEVREAAARSVLCWLATADAAGQPNVTPKEVFAIADDAHLVIANIAPSYGLFPEETTEASQERAALRAYGVVRPAGMAE